jgi:hypothetical protein
MQFDTETAANYAGQKLDALLERATRDANTAIENANIPDAVVYFSELRDTVKTLATKMSALQSLVDTISQELLPTLFGNQGVKTIKIDDIGRVSINDRWSASMLDKAAAFQWLHNTNNQSLIIETVNAATLGAFAKEEALAKRSLPSDIFKVSSTPYTSITKA